jgi:hypothetical protein
MRSQARGSGLFNYREDEDRSASHDRIRKAGK